jgi:hypothetical protein
MENIVMLFAMAQPLLDGAVVVPTVIARQGFNGQHIRIIKNFILLCQDSKSFASSFILVKVVFLFGKEGCFFDNSLVFLDDISMSGRQALKKC